jgi:enoyl-CoA hydratase/carnithine racemase
VSSNIGSDEGVQADDDPVLVEVLHGVAVITLHRPAVRNAFSGRMGEQLGAAYRRCDADDAVRAVVVTGTPPAFCAGADMTSGAATFAPVQRPTFSASPVEPPAWEVRKPVIAAVNGHAIGIGLTLALHCDLRFMAADAKYGIVQVRRGVMPDAMAHYTLPRLAGFTHAADVLLTGRTFDGVEAERLGIANRCLPADEVLPAAMETARDIAVNTAPLSVAFSKRLLWEALGLGPREVEQRETVLHHQLMAHGDAREGVTAFLERRAPHWTGSVHDEWPADWPGA